MSLDSKPVDVLESRLIAREKLERWRIQHSLRFCVGAVFMLLAYCVFYYIVYVAGQDLNYIPFLCAGFSLVLHSACVCLQVCQIRRWQAWRCDIGGWAVALTLLCDAALFALTREDVKLVLYRSIPDLDNYLGPAGISPDIRLEGCDIASLKQDVNITTQSLQFCLLYFICFVLSARHACFVGALAPTVYGLVGVALGTSKIMGDMSFGDLGLHVDLAIMFASVGIMVLAKVLIDRSKLQLFELLASQKEEIVNEKILRCEAEFAKETVLSQKEAVLSQSQATVAKESYFDTVSHYARSVQSSPPLLIPLVPESEVPCREGCDDCLPLHAMVWAENAKLPQFLRSLAPGERILCYDNVARSLTYAAIEKLEKSTNTEWVKVMLEDGSELELTADHPVSVKPEFGAPFHQQCIRAGELTAGRDKLMMLKMVWVPISDVSHAPLAYGTDECPEPGSITISVEQKERHEIFVTTSDKNGVPGPPIAVGASDRSLDVGYWSKKNTFVHFQASERTGLKRSNSDPCLAGSSLDQSRSDPSKAIFTLAKRAPTTIESSTTGSIYSCSSTLSKASDSIERQVKVGRAPYDNPSSNAASLSSLTRLKANNIPSFGSEHPAHACRSPCSFQFAGLVNAGRHICTAGALCEYCHDSGHQSHMSSKLRKLSRLPKHLAKLSGRPPQKLRHL